jgi:acyl-CoA reductase-like NAD-dependent aldehyde dehydrogenase
LNGYLTDADVPKNRFDEVKRAIVDTIPAFPVGDPADPKTAGGPMVNETQYQCVQSYVRKGIGEGAEVNAVTPRNELPSFLGIHSQHVTERVVSATHNYITMRLW